MKIEINRKDKTPVYIQIAGQIKNKLHTGEITDGYVLPSERVLAAELGVHRNTVTRAYGELKSEGLLDSSRGSCYRISFKGSAGYSETTEPDRRKAVSWEAVMRREYDEFISDFDELYSQSFNPGFISFAGGVGDMLGTVLGVILIQAFNTGLIMVNVSTFWQYVARGALLLFALTSDYIRKQRREKELLEASMKNIK